MPKRTIILFLIITSVLILFFGFFRVYEIFYSSYFNQTEYTQIAFIGNEEIPTKMEILFLEFKNLRTITISSIISILIMYGKKIVNRK